MPSAPVSRAASPAGVALGGLLALALLGTGLGCSDSDRDVTGSGTIELDEVDVASQIGGRVERLLVDEGDSVRVGDTLAVLGRGEVIAELGARAAEAERAVAQLRDLQAGARTEELDAARAGLDVAASQLRLAAAEATRAETLAQRQVISQAELDRAIAARDAAAAEQVAARRQYELLRAGSRAEQIRAAREAEAAARAQLEAARSQAHELVLRAPIDGVVLLRNVNQGEVARPNTAVVTLGDPQRLWVRVYVAAPRIGWVRRGDPVTLRVTGYPRTFRGRVTEIASKAEFTPRVALTEEERANLVFGVKVEIDSEGGVLKPGLPADAHIQASAGAAAAGGAADGARRRGRP